jgi:hypothetical protein
MSTANKITTSLESRNLQEFTDIVNKTSIFSNDIFGTGLLHHMLTKYPDLPLEFYKVVIDNPNTNLNIHNHNILPPLLRTSREDIIDLLLSKRNININLVFGDNKCPAIYAIDENNMTLLEKLSKKGGLSVTYPDSISYAMYKNMDAFRILIGLLEPYMCNTIKPVENAIRGNKTEALDLLLGAGCSINSESVKELVDSGSEGMISILIKYLPKLANKQVVLSVAVNNNNLELFKAVSEYTSDIDIDDIYRNLDKSVLIDNIIQLANSKNNQELIHNIFIAILKSKNREYYLLLNTLNVNKPTFTEIVGSLLDLGNFDELDELIEHTDVLKEVVSSLARELIVGLSKAGKVNALKKVVDNYDLKLDRKNIDLYEFVQRGQYDILLILLTKYQIIIGDDRIMSNFIENEQYRLVKLLIEKYMIVPKYNEIRDRLLDKPELVKAIVMTDPQILCSDLTAKELVNIMNSISEDSEVLNRFTDSLDIHTLTRSLRTESDIDLILKTPKHLLTLSEIPKLSEILLNSFLHRSTTRQFDEDDFDDEYLKYIVFELLRVLDSVQRDRVMKILTDNNLLDSTIIFDSLETVIQMDDDTDLFGYLLEQLKGRIVVYFPRLLRLNSMTTLKYIDDILKISFDVTDSIPTLMDLMGNPEFNEILRSSKAIDKVLDHKNMEVNSLIYTNTVDQEGDQHSLLDHIVGIVTMDDNNVKNWENQERLRLLKKVLLNPDVNVNIENIERETLVYYIINNILTFDNVDYESDENFSYPHAVLRLIIDHPSFDINLSRRVFPIMFWNTEAEYNYLLTILISRPECDINYCRILHSACDSKNLDMVRLVLTIPTLDINLVALGPHGKDFTAIHVAIVSGFVDGIKLLLEDPRIDITALDSKGRNYSRLAVKSGSREIVALFTARGLVDDKQERIEREIAEYDARMTAQGRVKQTRIRETLNSFDLILKERETREDELGDGNITAFNLSICPFCLTYLEKENAYECVYLSGHKCPEELENEPLKRLYFGDEWATKVFEICCTCGRPCEHHGHFKVMESGGPSELAINDSMANHWACDEHNGGGGKLEMVVRLVGMLSDLKRRVDLDERLVYGPELIRELSIIANTSLFNGAIRDRATSVLERKKWNVNSKIPKYAKFNAPRRNNGNGNGNNGSRRNTRNTREPIVYYHNLEEELQCMICLDEAEHLFKPHESDAGYICDNCIKRQVCTSRYASVTCELGCSPKKQIHKEDVNALMEGNFCEGVEVGEVQDNVEEN